MMFVLPMAVFYLKLRSCHGAVLDYVDGYVLAKCDIAVGEYFWGYKNQEL